MKKTLMVAASLLLAAPFAHADSFSGAWSVHASPLEFSSSESQSAFTDGLLFRDGMLSSAAFAMLGFSPTQYELNCEGSRESITATFTSEDRGTLSYRIVRMTSGLTGYMTWIRPDGTTSRYMLDGERYVEEEPLEAMEEED